MAMEKVSVTLPAELVEEAKARAGEGGLSRFLAESLEQRIRGLKLLEAVEQFEAQYGAVDPETVEQAKQWLP
ncbi:MAG TPA: hypothetical protein VK457_17820 [Chloroflexota bacterium]|nr:hypothetical protein [Chloroflexota bacterium]